MLSVETCFSATKTHIGSLLSKSTFPLTEKTSDLIIIFESLSFSIWKSAMAVADKQVSENTHIHTHTHTHTHTHVLAHLVYEQARPQVHAAGTRRDTD